MKKAIAQAACVFGLAAVSFIGGEAFERGKASPTRARAGAVLSDKRLIVAANSNLSMPDGTIFAGASPDTGKAMYTTPADAVGTYTQPASTGYCSALKTGGHSDWRVPTMGELNVLFQNHAAIGGFDTSGLPSGGWYWSSSHGGDGNWHDWAQRFKDGEQAKIYVYDTLSQRCVR